MDFCPKSHEKFVDSEKCFSLIKELQTTKLDPDGGEDNKISTEAERLFENFKKLIDSYQEQPELLDPYLSDLIQELTSDLYNFDISGSRYHSVFKFLYQLIKVVGFKSIGKKFPHEVDKLPLLIELLSKEDPKDKANWQTRFVLTVWLSIVILAPFDLVKFDSGSEDSEQRISRRIYSTLKRSLDLHDSCQHVTAYCLAKFFARPDVMKNDEHLSEFIDEALGELSSIKLGVANSMDDVKLIGYLRTLAYMYKFVARAEMKRKSDKILPVLMKLDLDSINRELVNHLIVKLVQRAGLALLPKRIAAWRYNRGSRILGQLNPNGGFLKQPANEEYTSPTRAGGQQNLLPSSYCAVSEAAAAAPDKVMMMITTNETKANLNENENEQDEDEEDSSSEHLESLLNTLFLGAHNSQTKVRWSAAKGIARLTSRLSRDRASDVIDMVMCNLLDTNSNEFAWHSGCLTLAEMSRLGMILEEKLADVTKIIGSAIIYDKIKGSFAVGSHIREAACYVCWAMARTYEDRLLKPYISAISINLLCTMLYDREVQCRRAASAAFQELVGRQGTFSEEGISILTNVDYQSVGQRQFAFLELALQVASYGEKYSRPFVEHLIEKKIGHWDVQIRRLASDSLSGLLLHLKPESIRLEVLAKLMAMFEREKENNINAKHGAILAMAKVIRGLVPLSLEHSFFDDGLVVEFVGKLVKECEKELKSKQQAPNFIEAISHIVCSAEAAKFNYPTSRDTTTTTTTTATSAAADSDSLAAPTTTIAATIKEWERVSLSALDSDNGELREIGSDAFICLYRSYYGSNKGEQDRLLTLLNRSVWSANESSRCGALKALSKLSRVSSSNAFQAPSSTSTIKTDADTPDIVLQSLTSYIAKETHEKASNVVFAQAKAEACEAFVSFIRHLSPERLLVSSQLIQAGYGALLIRAEDYTFDKRGDIGVVVRKAAVRALQELTLFLLSIGMSSLFDRERIAKIMAVILEQAVSYNDSAREQAGQSFYRLIGGICGLHLARGGSGGSARAAASELELEQEQFERLRSSNRVVDDYSNLAIPYKEEILSLFDKYEVNDVFNWRDDSTPIFVALLNKPEFSAHLWKGLMTSVGQVSDLSARQFRDSLAIYVNENFPEPEQREPLLSNFLDALEGPELPERLLSSGLIVADFLLTSGLMSDASLAIQERLLELCARSRGKGSGAGGAKEAADPKRLVSVARVLNAMVQFSGPVQRKALELCVALLVNGYAKVRTYAAEQLYLSLMTYQSADDAGLEASEKLEEAQELLSNSNWAEPLEKVRPLYAKLVQLLLP